MDQTTKPRRVLLVEREGSKAFRLTVPGDARMTFGPFSPPTGEEGNYTGKPQRAKGTLRIYRGGTTKSTEDILACFVGVTSFRDITEVEYEEQVVVEEGATIWKSDTKGYSRETKVSFDRAWQPDPAKVLTAGEPTEEGDENTPF